MALKLIQELTVEQYRARIYRDAEWNEYRVRFYLQSHYFGESCDYHTDDRQDAKDTAAAELRYMGKRSAKPAGFAYAE